MASVAELLPVVVLSGAVVFTSIKEAFVLTCLEVLSLFVAVLSLNVVVSLLIASVLILSGAAMVFTMSAELLLMPAVLLSMEAMVEVFGAALSSLMTEVAVVILSGAAAL